VIELTCNQPGAPTATVTIGGGLGEALRAAVGNRRAFVYFDPAIRPPKALDGIPSLAHTGGEAAKTLAGCERLLRAMSDAELDRDSLLLACGGGVVGDLGGLAAALYLRGIEYWQVPTTLLAMVDSSVGGKTAANLPQGKNLVGAFHPAARTLIDVGWLGSLPEREFRSGLAEAAKIAIGMDAELFARLEARHDAIERRDEAELTTVVHRCVAAKLAIVERDPYEHGDRRLLNLGHTLGHALEAAADYSIPHGLCVARGLHFAIHLAETTSAMPPREAMRARALLERLGFARDPLPPIATLTPYLARDKKRRGTAIRFAMPTGIGTSEIRELDLQTLLAALASDVAS
jgi:3-dehydroquinate synthase